MFEQDWDAARPPLRQNVQRGGVAERRLERIFRRHGYSVERQLPVVFLNRQGVPESGWVDLVPVPGSNARTAPSAFESKFVNLARYRLLGGGLDLGRLRSLVDRHVDQILRYQQGLSAINGMRTLQGLEALPRRVRLIYQVPHATAHSDAAAFQRLALNVARPRGITVTVIMPGSRASRR